MFFVGFQRAASDCFPQISRMNAEAGFGAQMTRIARMDANVSCLLLLASVRFPQIRGEHGLFRLDGIYTDGERG